MNKMEGQYLINTKKRFQKYSMKQKIKFSLVIRIILRKPSMNYD